MKSGVESKRQYKAPKLTEFGSLVKLTAAGTAGQNENAAHVGAAFKA
jgi:hypothetical protein